MARRQKKIAHSTTRMRFSLTPGNAVRSLLPKRRRMRQMMVMLLALILNLAPFPLSKSFVPAAQAQVLIPQCGGPNHIFQGCPTFDSTLENTLEDAAISEVLAAHDLPATDRSRLLGWGRGEIRAQLYNNLYKSLKVPLQLANPTDALVTNTFQKKIDEKRLLAAKKALEEYYAWRSNKCLYSPPNGFTYSPGAACYGLSGAFVGDPPPPSFDEFEAFGVARAFDDFYKPDAQLAAKETARGIRLGVSLAAAGVGGSVLGVALYAVAGDAILKAVVPFAFRLFAALPETASGAPAAAAGTLAAPVAIIVIALTVAITRGVDVFEAEGLENKLKSAITNVDSLNNNRLSAYGLTTTTTGRQELFAHFTLMTLPDYPGTDAIPAPQPNDGTFRLQAQGSSAITTNANLNYQSWDDEDANARPHHTARLNNGWFIDKDNQSKESYALSIRYINWQGEKWTASRKGLQFIHTNDAINGDPKASFVSSDIQFQDWSGNKLKASLNLQVLGAKGLTLFINRTTTSTQQVAEITTGGQTISALQIGAIDPTGASATADGVTVSNLAVDAQGKMTASISAGCDASRTSFILKVSDNVGQSVTTTLRVALTPIVGLTGNPLPAAVPNGKVGVPYSAFLFQNLFLSCQGVTYTLSLNAGQIPHGLKLGFTEQCVTTGNIITCTSGYYLYGTPTSGGTFTFSVLLHFSNGDDLIAPYTVKIESNVAEIPTGLASWWRANGNPYDVIGSYQGKLMGSNVWFEEGLIQDAFDFNPSSLFSSPDAYVALPPEIFPFPTTGGTANQPFSFEFWFNTPSGGALLGQQNVSPGTTGAYNTPTKFVPAIYVGLDSKLRVEMFDNGAINPITSPDSVPKHIWNHVAVVYDGTNEIAYLNGEEIGRAPHTQRGYASNYFYQLGTAYAVGWPSGISGRNFTGWYNFIGQLDEPSFYTRALTADEVKSIFAAGDAGKMRISTINTSPLCNGANSGSIQVKVDGGTGLNQYSIDAGTTYQSNNFFSNLLASPYQVKVKDTLGHTIAKTVTLSDPPVLSFTTTPVNPSCFTTGNGSITVNATGGTGALKYSKDNGQTFQDSNVFSNLAAGTYKVVVKDSGGCNTASQTVTLSNGNPTLTYAPNPSTTYGTALSLTPLTKPSDKGITSTFGLVNPPSGVTIDSAGVVNVATTVPPGSYTIQVRATDACNGTLDAFFSLSVGKAPLTLTVNNAWRTQSEANPPLSGTLTGLKNGDNITASYSTTANAGSAPGDYPITATLSDPNNRLGNYQVTNNPGTLTILNGCGITVNPATLPAATRGTPFVQTLSASPTGSYVFSLLSGTLPPGLTLLNTLGIYSLRGTPTTAGSYTFTIKAKKNNSTCEGARTYTIVVP